MLSNQPNLHDELARRAAVRQLRRCGGDGTAPKTLAALRAVLDQEIDRLPAKHKTAVILRYLEGRTIDETAALLGWDRRRVCTQLRLGRRTLLQRLRQQGLTLPGPTFRRLMRAEAKTGVLSTAKCHNVARLAMAGSADEDVGRTGLPCRVAELVRAALAGLGRYVAS